MRHFRYVRFLLLMVAQSSVVAAPSNQANANPACGGSSTVRDYSPALAPRSSDFLIALQHAVATNDKVTIAAMLHYPVAVYSIKEIKGLSTSAQFIRDYSRIMTPQMKKAIEAQTSECLFANWQGVMIGNGEVWAFPFSKRIMKIITFNVPHGSESMTDR